MRAMGWECRLMGHMLEGNFIEDIRASYTNRCQNSRHFTGDCSTMITTLPFRTWTALWSKHLAVKESKLLRIFLGHWNGMGWEEISRFHLGKLNTFQIVLTSKGSIALDAYIVTLSPLHSLFFLNRVLFRGMISKNDSTFLISMEGLFGYAKS